MIGLFLAMQIAGSASTASAPTFIVVRDGQTTTSVPVTISDGQAFVRADLLVKAMKGTLIFGTNQHYTLALPRAHLDLIDGIPFAKFYSVTVPLTRAPQVRGGQLYLPFQFVSEVIPRYGGGYFYDVALGELRTFASATASRPPPTGAATSPSSGGVYAGSGVQSPSPGIPSPSSGVASPSGVVAAPPVTPRRTRPAAPPAPKVVVIDAGHGGPDRGMTGPIGSPVWFTEKDVTLSVAKKIAAVLRARGVDVLMTRTTDTLIALAERRHITNNNNS
jgi:N-acetylmuramoyl-L-alanine amidase